MSDDYTADYLAFYDAYPRHEGKQDGFKAWRGLPQGSKVAALADVEKRNRHNAWSSNKKLVPLPATFLRGARWEDDWQSTQTSSSANRDGKPNSGPVQYRPLESEYDLDKWTRLANRWCVKWLRCCGGLTEQQLQDFMRIRAGVIAEMSAALDEDIAADGSRESQVDAIWTFLGVLTDRLDQHFGRQFKSILMRADAGESSGVR